MNILEEIKETYRFNDNSKISLLIPCLMISGFVLSIFIPWSKIFRSNEITEVIVGLLCVFLIGLLVLFVFECLLVLSYISMFILYPLFIIKNWKIKRARLLFCVFSFIMILSFVKFREVQDLFIALFTGSWWGDSAYFGKGF